MPPKKKGKDKKKGDKSKKEKKEGPEPKIDVVDETSKQFYLLQIGDLEEKLQRYQKKSDELELLCNKYEGEYESLSSDKKDIISNLIKEMERKVDEILDLNDRLVGLQQAKDAEKEAFEKQLTDLRTEFQETKDSLTNQNNTLLAKLAALDEFKTQKEDLLAKLSDLEQKIEFIEKENQDKLYEIEKKVVLDKDRLKKEMIVRVNQVASDFRRVSNKQMADTTKRAIKENVSINTQLQKMSQKIVEIVSENENVKINEKNSKQQINLLEDNEKELSRKNVSNIKVIRMLTEKCRSQEAMIAELEDKFNEMQESEANNSQIIMDLEKQSEDLKKVTEENQNFRTMIKNLQDENKAAEKYRTRVDKVLKEATNSLTLALSRNAAIAKASSMNNINSNENEWNDIEKRDYMLENMLILLNSAAALGFGPKPEDFGSNGYQRPRTSEYPGSGKGIRKSQILPSPLGKNSGGFNPHYSIGDLGIVPRQEDHVLTNKEKMSVIQPQKELRSLQRVTRKSIATQTIDSSKASVFSKFDFALEKEVTNLHPLYENKEKKNSNKSNLYPMTATNRVTDKVF